MGEDKDPIIDLNTKLLEKLFPFEHLPSEVKNVTMEYVSFRRELTTESDRGCALLAASHLEYMLEQVLRTKLCGSKKNLDSLFNFNGPLGTFSGRILITYSIGLISKKHLNDIQLIRKIRNEFGHSYDIIDFENPKISNLTSNLKLIANSRATTSRKKFITSVSFISGTLQALILFEKKIEEQEEVDVEERKKITDTFGSSRKNN